VFLSSHVALYTQVKLADNSLVSGRIVVGCDGINSVCRAAVTDVSTSDSKARHCGEICYR
jgi:2-polyprenyl-6-methoxyphenol hydroxylase-like FAD-dependent oxidoreductase